MTQDHIKRKYSLDAERLANKKNMHAWTNTMKTSKKKSILTQAFQFEKQLGYEKEFIQLTFNISRFTSGLTESTSTTTPPQQAPAFLSIFQNATS